MTKVLCSPLEIDVLAFQRPTELAVLQRRHREGVHLFHGGQLRHAQVQLAAAVRQRGGRRVHGQPRDGPPQRDRLHQLEPVLHRLQAR